MRKMTCVASRSLGRAIGDYRDSVAAGPKEFIRHEQPLLSATMSVRGCRPVFRSRISINSLLGCVPVALAGLVLLPLWLVLAVQLAAESGGRRLAARKERGSVRFGPVWIGRFSGRTAVALFVALIAGGTAVAGLLVSGNYTGSSQRLAAWAVALAGGTLVAAVVGLPAALVQLSTLRQEVDRITRASDFERGLNDLLLPGVELFARAHHDEGDIVRTEMLGWTEVIAQYIREQTANTIEESLFRLAGQDLGPRAQLEQKILYVRDKLIPKVRAGYW